MFRLGRLRLLNVCNYSSCRLKSGALVSGAEVRRAFFDYFVNEHQHTYWHSSSIVPQADSYLSFVNAGMYQAISLQFLIIKLLFLVQADFSRHR